MSVLPSGLSTQPRIAPVALISEYAAKVSCQTADYNTFVNGSIDR